MFSFTQCLSIRYQSFRLVLTVFKTGLNKGTVIENGQKVWEIHTYSGDHDRVKALLLTVAFSRRGRDSNRDKGVGEWALAVQSAA